MNRTHLITVVAAAAIAAAAWIDPLYFPLALLGPLATGLVAGARGADRRAPVATWALAGVLILLSDLAINGEDVAFHVVMTAIMAGLVVAGAAAGRLGRRRPATA